MRGQRWSRSAPLIARHSVAVTWWLEVPECVYDVTVRHAELRPRKDWAIPGIDWLLHNRDGPYLILAIDVLCNRAESDIGFDHLFQRGDRRSREALICIVDGNDRICGVDTRALEMVESALLDAVTAREMKPVPNRVHTYVLPFSVAATAGNLHMLIGNLSVALDIEA
jgi:hypothetical protein